MILNAFETPGQNLKFSSSSIACLVPLIPRRERFRNTLLFSIQSAQFVANQIISELVSFIFLLFLIYSGI